MADYKVGDVIRYVATGNVIDDVEQVYSDGKLIGGTDNYLSKDYDGTKEYYQVMLGTVYSREIENGVGTIGVSPNFAELGEDDEYTFDEGEWRSFSVNSTTGYYEMTEGRNAMEINARTSDDLVPALDNNNPEDATQVLVVTYNKVVKGVYILGSTADDAE